MRHEWHGVLHCLETCDRLNLMTRLIHSPSQIVNPLQRRRFIGYGTASGGSTPFAGAMDSYETGMVALVCPHKRLLTSWTGYAFTAMRADAATMDVPYTASGIYDAAALTSWLAGQTWGFSKLYDQTGNNRPLLQATQANQPAGAVDGDGFVHAVSLPAGATTTNMRSASGLAINCTNTTDTTWWGVAASPAGSHLVGMASTTPKLRNWLNFGNSMVGVVDDTGGFQPSSTPKIYSAIAQVNGSGNRLNNGDDIGTTALAGAAFVIDQLSLGYDPIFGIAWPQDARVYVGCWWSRMLSNTDADAVQAVGQATFITPAGNLWCWEPQDAMQWETGIDIQLN